MFQEKAKLDTLLSGHLRDKICLKKQISLSGNL